MKTLLIPLLFTISYTPSDSTKVDTNNCKVYDILGSEINDYINGRCDSLECYDGYFYVTYKDEIKKIKWN